MSEPNSTSAVTSEVAKDKPAVKQSAEAKLIAEILKAYAALQQSDANWEKNGMAFGRKCSEWRIKYSKQGSHKGLGFEKFCLMHGINYRKARYWADKVEKKIKPCYEGGEDKGTNTKGKTGAKPKGFVLDLRDDQQAEMSKMVPDTKAFSLLVHQVATEPGAASARLVVKHILAKLNSPKAQFNFLCELGDWIDGQRFDFEQELKGAAIAPPPVPELTTSVAVGAN